MRILWNILWSVLCVLRVLIVNSYIYCKSRRRAHDPSTWLVVTEFCHRMCTANLLWGCNVWGNMHNSTAFTLVLWAWGLLMPLRVGMLSEACWPKASPSLIGEVPLGKKESAVLWFFVARLEWKGLENKLGWAGPYSWFTPGFPSEYLGPIPFKKFWSERSACAARGCWHKRSGHSTWHSFSSSSSSFFLRPLLFYHKEGS